MEEKGKTYAVLIIDNFHMDPEHESVVDGFPTLELAKEYARRRTRDSLEEFREPDRTRENLREMWYAFGESASVLGGEYFASKEIDYFIEHPASQEERDWQSIKKKAGIK